MAQLGFIGGGNMASAIIHGILKGGTPRAQDIMVCEPDAEKRADFARQGLQTGTDCVELARACKYLVLAVKPQVMEGVLEQLAPAVTAEHVLISIAAGITVEFLRKKIGFNCKVVPVMPNTPLLLGCGAVAMARVEPISDEEFAFARGLFALSGQVELIPADRLNEVIPVNGSSPAFLYYFAKVLCEHCETYGLDTQTTNRLFCHTLIGSARMMLETGKTHDELIAAVCSPGGTTLKGLEALEQNGFDRAITAAADACVRRAYELGK